MTALSAVNFKEKVQTNAYLGLSTWFGLIQKRVEAKSGLFRSQQSSQIPQQGSKNIFGKQKHSNERNSDLELKTPL